MSFNGRTTSEEVVAGLDLTAKTVVVTGASGGLGFEASRVLAGAGATVIMAARSPEKNASAMARIAAAHPGAKLKPVVLDLASPDSVRQAAARILAAHPKIDALINNAGIMGGPFVLTPEGNELHFQVDHLGPFLLTGLLVPALKAAAPSRIVNLSSAGHRMPGFDLDDPNFAHREYVYHAAYCQAKRANILHAVALAKRLAPFGITANAVHPGAIRTEVFRDLTDSDADMAIGWSAMSGSPEKTPSQGASTEVWAAVSPESEGLTGQYFEDCRIAEIIPSDNMGAVGVVPEALDPELAERLWTLSERLVGQSFTFA
jgi:NAD(P)-dependent dehydrogenase (short-subunit alcohol dehydrogenase family)